jgi:hypothetical protein
MGISSYGRGGESRGILIEIGRHVHSPLRKPGANVMTKDGWELLILAPLALIALSFLFGFGFPLSALVSVLTSPLGVVVAIVGAFWLIATMPTSDPPK